LFRLDAPLVRRVQIRDCNVGSGKYFGGLLSALGAHRIPVVCPVTDWLKENCHAPFPSHFFGFGRPNCRRRRLCCSSADRHPGGGEYDLRDLPIVVKKTLERVPGVTSTSVDFDKKTATVTFDPDKATSAKLTQATTEAGFPSKVVSKP